MILLDKLTNKTISEKSIVNQVINSPHLLSDLIEGTSSYKPRIKYRSIKLLKLISEKSPQLLYSRFDFFYKLIHEDNNIIKWNSIDIISNLSSVDTLKKFDRISKDYFSFIYDKTMITAAHVVESAPVIFENKPDLRNFILESLSNIEHQKRNSECRNILLGKVILSLKLVYSQIEDKKRVLAFVRNQLVNSRRATQTKAEEFIKKFDKN